MRQRVATSRASLRRAVRTARAGLGDPAQGRELAERLERTRRSLLELYAQLSWFAAGSASHREALRRALDWPQVGHVTSLARALAEEDRFIEWLRFNRLMRRLARAA